MRGRGRHHHGAWRNFHDRPGPYRSRRGLLFGVCRGLAEYFGLSTVGVRIVFVIIALGTSLGPMVVVYLLAAMLMPIAPVIPPNNDAETEFYNSYTASRSMAILRIKRTFDHLERRVQRIESMVTSRDYDWDQRLNNRT